MDKKLTKSTTMQIPENWLSVHASVEMAVI